MPASRKPKCTREADDSDGFEIGTATPAEQTSAGLTLDDAPVTDEAVPQVVLVRVKPEPAAVQPAATTEEVLPSSFHQALALLKQRQAEFDGCHPRERALRHELLLKLQRIRQHVFKMQQGSTAPVILADDRIPRRPSLAEIERTRASLT